MEICKLLSTAKQMRPHTTSNRLQQTSQSFKFKLDIPSSEVGNSKNAAQVLEEDDTRHGEGGKQRDIEPAVPVQQRRVISRKLHALDEGRRREGWMRRRNGWRQMKGRIRLQTKWKEERWRRGKMEERKEGNKKNGVRGRYERGRDLLLDNEHGDTSAVVAVEEQLLRLKFLGVQVWCGAVGVMKRR